MSKLAAPLFLVVLAIGAVLFYAPWLTEQRAIVAATPSLDGISYRAEVKVPGGETACIRPVPIDPNVREVRMLLDTRGHPARAVDVTLTGPGGYRASGRFANYAPSGATIVATRLSEAPPRAADGQLCLRNTGHRAIGLVGTSEPESVTVPVTYVGDKPPGQIDPAVTFLAGKQRSVAQQAGLIFDRAGQFTGVIPGWLMWPLALLFVLALPVGAAAALLLAARDEPESSQSAARTIRQ
jgi:hypothetical protein